MIEPDRLLLESGMQESIYSPQRKTAAMGKLLKILAPLPRRSWSLCGGGAVACYVERTVSPDIDLLVDGNLNREIWSRLDPGLLQPNLAGCSFDLGGIPVDLIEAETPWDYAALDDAQGLEFGGHGLRVVPCFWLLATKLQVGREKDLNDAGLLWRQIRTSAGWTWEFVRYLRTYMERDMVDLIDGLDSLEMEMETAGRSSREVVTEAARCKTATKRMKSRKRCSNGRY